MSQPPSSQVSSPSRPIGWMVLSAILALLLVAELVAVVVLGSTRDDEPEASGDEYDYAAATCEIAATVPESFDGDDLAMDRPLVWELQALAFNAVAAGHVDREQSEYRTAGEGLQSALAATDLARILQVTADLRSHCD